MRILKTAALWINSLMIPGPDDGKLAVANTRLPDTTDHLVLPATHPYLMKNKRVIRSVMRYLSEGTVKPAADP